MDEDMDWRDNREDERGEAVNGIGMGGGEGERPEYRGISTSSMRIRDGDGDLSGVIISGEEVRATETD